MDTNNQRLLHTFAALADLGEQIANTSDFEEMLRSSFHLLLGSVAIRRGAVAQYDRQHDTLRIVTSRGLEQTPDANFSINRDHARALATAGSSLTASDATAEATRLMTEHPKLFTSSEIQILLPLVVHDRLIDVLLGEKASGENSRTKIWLRSARWPVTSRWASTVTIYSARSNEKPKRTSAFTRDCGNLSGNRVRICRGDRYQRSIHPGTFRPRRQNTAGHRAEMGWMMMRKSRASRSQATSRHRQADRRSERHQFTGTIQRYD
jgi:hypothetical protein